MRTLLLTVGLAMALLGTTCIQAEELVPNRDKVNVGDGSLYKFIGEKQGKWTCYTEQGFVWYFMNRSQKPKVVTRRKISPNGDTSPWFVQSLLVDGRAWIKIKHVPKGHTVFVEFENGEWFKITCTREPRNKRE